MECGKRLSSALPHSVRNRLSCIGVKAGRVIPMFNPLSVVVDANRGVEIAWDLVGVGELRDELECELLYHNNPKAARHCIKPKAHGGSLHSRRARRSRCASSEDCLEYAAYAPEDLFHSWDWSSFYLSRVSNRWMFADPSSGVWVSYVFKLARA